MKNNLNEIIRERLENRLEWKNYLGWLLTHRELHRCAKRKFYEDKPFLNLVLTINIADNKYERNTKFQAIYNWELKYNVN